MSERGTFAVDRGIWSDTDFAPEPFSEREAFLWLVGEAAWARRAKRIDGRPVVLERGQLCLTVRHMAEVWQWSKSRVDRFLARIETRGMIARDKCGTSVGQEYGTASGTRVPVITICNYERFQTMSAPSGTSSGTSLGQENSPKRDNPYKQRNNTPPIVPPTPPEQAEAEPQAAPAGKPKAIDPKQMDLGVLYGLLGGKLPGQPPAKPKAPKADVDAYRAEFAELWPLFPKRGSAANPRKPAEAKYIAIRRSGVSREVIERGVRAFEAAHRDRRKEERCFVPMAKTWLHGAGWEDYAADQAAGGRAGPAAAPQELPEDMWRKFLSLFKSGASQWPVGLGPLPGQPGCRAPAALLAEYGFPVKSPTAVAG